MPPKHVVMSLRSCLSLFWLLQIAHCLARHAHLLPPCTQEFGKNGLLCLGFQRKGFLSSKTSVLLPCVCFGFLVVQPFLEIMARKSSLVFHLIRHFYEY